MSNRIYFLLTSAALYLAVAVHGQISFIPNQHQWNDNSLFQADLPSGRVFFEQNKIVYSYCSTEDLGRIHDSEIGTVPDDENNSGVKTESESDDSIRCFAFQVEFLGAQKADLNGRSQKNYNTNYFLGKDPSHWASNVPVYGELMYSSVYPGIDVKYYSEKNQLKYDFIVSPGSDPTQVVMRYSGQKSIELRQNNLLLDLGFTSVKEVIPLAYQVKDGVKRVVRCTFSLLGDEVRFIFPDGYDHSLPLVIDPVVIASTYSGGTCSTRGYCSTYDDQGNIYSAGICFSTGFPVTLGAYSVSYAGGNDIGINKFNPDGSSLLYCTYLGGSVGESPHSMIVQNGNLYLFGSSFSPDFPVTAQAYSQSLNGGNFNDMIICCLSSSGSALIASTYIGGTWTDGLNMILAYRTDAHRGEIIIAANGDVLVTGCVMSQNFPTTPGAYRATSTGGEDAIVFRMDASLSNLIWATYIGSGVHDAGYGIREGLDGSIYICGTSNNMFTQFPTVPGCYMTTPSGASDAYIARFNSTGTALLSCTFFGGAGRDIAYFLDIDIDGDVYVFGEARNPTATSDAYSNPGSKNYVAKFDPALTTLDFCAVVGGGSSTSLVATGPVPSPPSTDPHVGYVIPTASIVPTAFRVDKCKRIYFCGYGGDENWALTPDALLPYNGDNQFYAGVLEENATDLLSSTRYAGYHIDGGMGRIDEHGVLYQSVCLDGTYFPTTPNAFSDGSAAADADLGVFKIDLHVPLVKEILLPNIFTPNGDGINDYYVPPYILTDHYITTIYDRYGTQLFTSSEQDVTWDGTFNGKGCAEGVYYVAIEFEVCFEMFEQTGFVHLQR